MHTSPEKSSAMGDLQESGKSRRSMNPSPCGIAPVKIPPTITKGHPQGEIHRRGAKLVGKN
jgi:hypothetical protein